MWSSNYAKCLVRGHVLSSFIYKGEEYNRCVRCGKIGLNHYTRNFINAEPDSNYTYNRTAGMKMMMDISR